MLGLRFRHLCYVFVFYDFVVTWSLELDGHKTLAVCDLLL